MKTTLLVISLVLTQSLFAANGEIKCSKKVASRHEKKILRDIERLDQLKFSGETSAEDLSILGVDHVDAARMKDWLTDRVQYIIDDSEPIDRLKLDVASRYYVYPEVSVFPDMESVASGPVFGFQIPKAERAVTVMSNIGAVLYMAGKSSKQLLQVKIPLSLFKADKVLVNSPRTGIIQIGEGLFMKKFMFNEKEDDAVSNSISRLMTFFHEARHSDGHGKSLGFLHAICPAGHDLAGYSACDRNLNGPYTIGRIMAKEFLNSCDSCSENEKEQIRLGMIESESRVIRKTIIPGKDEGMEISMLRTMIKSYQTLIELTPDGASRQEYQNKIDSMNAQLQNLLAQSGKAVEVPSKFWDANPEGTR